VSGNRPITKSEIERDDLVRTFPCPVCKAKAGKACNYRRTGYTYTSHEGRYRVAAEAGVVPMLAGMSRG
jgi:hypothetical protein